MTDIATSAPPSGVGLLTTVIVLGGFMVGLDTSLVNVGLTAIATDLHASLPRVQWITSGYLLALAAALPAGPWLQRRFGSSRVWFVALLGFVTASLLCAVAPGLSVLVFARVVQGMAGGLLVPTGQAIVAKAVGPANMGKVMSSAGLVLVLAPAIGPALGGLLIETTSWRWLFAVNIPVGLLAAILARRVLPHTDFDVGATLDVVGLLLLSSALPALSLGLTHLHLSRDQGSFGLMSTALGALLFVIFVVAALHPRRSAAALIDIRLFRSARYTVAQFTVFFTGLNLFGGLILLPLYYEALRSFSAFTTGLLLMAYGLGAMAALPIAGRLSDRLGGGVTCVIGLSITIIATLPFVFLPSDASLIIVESLQALRGIGVGMAGLPAMTSAFRAAPDNLADATTTANILQRVGGSLGSAMIVLIIGGGPALAITAFQNAHALLVLSATFALLSAGVLATLERRSSPPK